MNRNRWPLVLIAIGTFVAIWTGWVQLGAMTGFGWMHPLPGIIPGLRMNAVITLPVSVEAYGAYALGVWLSAAGVPDRARSFARWSAIGALALGWTGQAASHVLTAAHVTVAPWPVTVLVSSVPVAAFGLAVALTHLLRSTAQPETAAAEVQQPSVHLPAAAPVTVPQPQPHAPADAQPMVQPATAAVSARPVQPQPARSRKAARSRSRGAPVPLEDAVAAARAKFAPSLALGVVPSQRQIIAGCGVGQDRAKVIHAALEKTITGGMAMASNGNGAQHG
jgi:hypothetical protein